MIGQFLQTSYPTTDTKYPVVSLVSSLLNRSFPSYIARFIVSVIVNPSKAFTGWAFTKVIKERLERLFPTHTNFYAPQSITPVLWILCICATLNHSRPTIIRSGDVGLSVFPESCSRFFGTKTPTGLSESFTKTRIANDAFLTAGTNANTSRLRRVFGCSYGSSIGDYEKSSKMLSDKRRFFGHNDGRIVVKVSGGRSAVTDARCDYYERV